MAKMVSAKRKMPVDEFIQSVLMDDINEIVNHHKLHYIAFGLMAQGMEFLGACLDQYPFEKERLSDSRFRGAVRELFRPIDERYYTFTRRGKVPDLYKGLRCTQTHILRPGAKVAYTHRDEAKKQGTAHLEKTDGKLILVCEELYDDLRAACAEIIGRIRSGTLKGPKFNKPYLTITSYKNT